MPFCRFFVELAATVATRHPVIDFIRRHGRLRHGSSPVPFSTPSSPSTASGESKRDGLASCFHHLPQLIRLGLPFGDWSSGFCLFNFLVNCSSSFGQHHLLAIDNPLLYRVEHFPLLRKDLLADVLVACQSFWVEGPTTVIALFQSICSSACIRIWCLLWVCIWT